MAVLTKKVAGFGLMDLGVIAVSKLGGEMILTSFVGNGTLKSGVVKLVLAGVATKVNKNVAMGVGLDGAEDIVIGTGIKNMILGQRDGNNGGW